MKTPQWRSLETRVTLFTLAIFLVSIWSLALYASRMLREDIQHMLGEQQFSTVAFLAAEVNRQLLDRSRALENAAARLTPKMISNPAAAQAFLEQRQALQGMFNGGIFVTRIDATAIADTPRTAKRLGVNYAERDYISIPLKEGRPTIGKPVIGKGLKTPVFGIGVPIRDAQGKVIGALAGITNLAQQNFLDGFTENHYGKTGGYLLVAPQHRLIVTATDKSRIMEASPQPGVFPLIDRFLQGWEGSGVGINPRGIEVLASAKSVPAAGWYVNVALPTTEAFAPIIDMQQRMLWATLLLTLLAGGLTLWMIRRQLSPMRVAAKTLITLSRNGRTPQPLPVVRHDEIGALIGGFNQLLASLGQREALLKQIFDTSSVAIFVVDMQGRITQANQRMAEMFGCDLESLLHKEYVALVHPGEREISRQKMRALLDSNIASVDVDRLYWRTDQTEFWGHLTGKRFYDANGNECGLVGVIADITVRKQAEQKNQLAASVFTHAREGILITDVGGTIIDVNEAFSRITGFSRAEALGQNPRILSSGKQDKTFYEEMWRDLIEKSHWHNEIWNHRKNGELYAAMMTISTVRDEQGAPLQYVALFSDITAIKAHQSQLEHIAHYDALTNLPNRVLLADRLRQSMIQTQRRDRRLAVAYLDLDGFKAINDHHGHEAGDQLLIALASRMKQALREGDTLARLGGDEFIAVLQDLADVASSVPMLNRLLAAAAQPVHVGDLVLQVSASIGVTFYPQADNVVDADQLLRQSDLAMYQAKVAGKNRFHVFDAEQDSSVRGHHESMEHIRQALSAQEFVLYYQPKVNMRTGKVVGAEALIRWQHPVQGLLLPGVFLPVIEDQPLAVDIGEWVINSALAQMAQWRAAGLNIPVSVNVGARQLQDADFVNFLRGRLAEHPDLPPGNLELEVLETSALEDLAGVSQVIEACREIGVMFALDDFGTGYSSLTYLKRLAVNMLKIDQSFVRDMLDDPDDLAILEGVLGLAGAFRRQVIAEGVETVEQGEMLLRLGCELAQGYGIARPMPAANLPAWAQAWRPEADWHAKPAVSRDNLPLLFASVEHRAWVMGIETHLRDTSKAVPPLDPQKCRFSDWLRAAAESHHGEHLAFQSVDPIHQQVHALAAELLALKATGQGAEALARLGELHHLRDTLVEQLKALVAQPVARGIHT